jgi:enoyl-CoA hydratase/carnithine racemase/phosphopantetheinyl transferase (holo-ACP synthase)
MNNTDNLIKHNHTHLIMSIDEFRDKVLTVHKPDELFSAAELMAFPPDKSIKSLAGRYLIKKCFFELLAIAPDYTGIELLNNDMGKPEMTFSRKLHQIIEERKILSVSCSMSHSRNHATGMVAVVYQQRTPEFSTISWSIDEGIGQLVLNQPPNNKMNKQFFEELKSLYHEIITKADLKAIIISGKGRHFSAGADLDEMLQRILEDHRNNREPEFLLNNSAIFNFFENLNIPVIAAIRGVCIGSAFELALSCHFRFCEEGSLLALPESTFNLMPGCGGTQLLTRLAGFSKAVEIILEGRNLSPEEALSLGIIDKITPRKQVVQNAVNFAKEITDKKDPGYSKTKLYCS